MMNNANNDVDFDAITDNINILDLDNEDIVQINGVSLLDMNEHTNNIHQDTTTSSEDELPLSQVGAPVNSESENLFSSPNNDCLPAPVEGIESNARIDI